MRRALVLHKICKEITHFFIYIYIYIYSYLSFVVLIGFILLSLQAQQSLDLIQSKIVKAAGDTTVIENSDVSQETVCIFFSSKSLS